MSVFRALVAELLRDAGHEAVRAGDVGLLGKPDVEVMALAVEQARVVVSADTDFGELLALGGYSMPSVILLRRNHDPHDQSATILSVMADVSDDLDGGAVVVVADRVRVRSLPIE
jgi:predicted nuclease of predicted toxin-antitoxin system